MTVKYEIIIELPKKEDKNTLGEAITKAIATLGAKPIRWRVEDLTLE